MPVVRHPLRAVTTSSVAPHLLALLATRSNTAKTALDLRSQAWPHVQKKSSHPIVIPVMPPMPQDISWNRSSHPASTWYPVQNTRPEPCRLDRKSTRLNSSHVATSNAVFCL